MFHKLHLKFQVQLFYSIYSIFEVNKMSVLTSFLGHANSVAILGDSAIHPPAIAWTETLEICESAKAVLTDAHCGIGRLVEEFEVPNATRIGYRHNLHPKTSTLATIALKAEALIAFPTKAKSNLWKVIQAAIAAKHKVAFWVPQHIKVPAELKVKQISRCWYISHTGC